MAQPLTLAITTIGDLLLENKITKDKNNKPIENIQLTIPEYQRPYKEVYRVRTRILHVDEKDTYNIVDGQQRTITFALLLKAMGETKIAFLRQNLFNNQFNAFNVLNNYRGLERRIKNIKNEKECSDLLDYIKNNCELIVVSTGDISEAFQFFDSQNARGKKLYPHDLLKAYHLRERNICIVLKSGLKGTAHVNLTKKIWGCLKVLQRMIIIHMQNSIRGHILMRII